ncbi:MAG: hypothetical protein DMD87_17285 [Candidatus Rokuibacteriota bacterium]|nr:MAG: hypothetical protein DMD87_17285 [Candidatus Rokubacteria bacterium]
MAAKTLRDLISGSGTVDTTSSSNKLVFSSAQQFKAGTTIKLSGGQIFTIQEGMGTSWTAKQKATATVSGSSFTVSDTGTGRTRGSSGVIVPWGVHTIYCSLVDDVGSFDYYTYVDTLMPEGGLHPYTKDPVVGAFYATMAGDSPSMLTLDRMRMLEGIVRGSTGTTFGNPDARLDTIESKLAPAILAGGTDNVNLGNSANSFGPLVGPVTLAASSAAGFRTVVPRAGTIKNLFAAVSVAPGASKSWAFMVRKNGVDQSLTCTISGASATSASDTSHSFTVAAGDEIEIKIVPTSTPAAAKAEWSAELVVADAGDGGVVDTLLSRGDA